MAVGLRTLARDRPLDRWEVGFGGLSSAASCRAEYGPRCDFPWPEWMASAADATLAFLAAELADCPHGSSRLVFEETGRRQAGDRQEKSLAHLWRFGSGHSLTSCRAHR